MAVNKTLTECTELAVAPASDDWLLVVDKSDTTDDPDGTSKKMSVANAIKAWPFEHTYDVGDESTAITTGTAKKTFRAPRGLTLGAVRASLTVAQTSGSIFTVDINEGGVSILSTKLTVDNGEKTSQSAATPAVISDPDIADDAEITIDVDQVGDGTAKGLKITLIGTRG